MPWLLYRYMTADLLRIIGLSVSVLVTVIAFGATIKPLASDNLLDAGQTAKYMALAIVPMLQFALPFAAGFGATLTLHRMTTDNEIQAMAVGGLSYRRIMLPILALGLALSLLMVLLTQWVIPQFWSLIAQTLATDVTSVFQSAIRRGEPIRMEKLQIYADDIAVTDNPAGPDGPDTRMVLLNVAAAEFDDDGRIVTDVTANQAVADVYQRDGRTYLKLVMNDTVAYNSATGDLVRSARIVPTRPLILAGTLKDYPKGLTRGQLLALRDNPDGYGQVMEAKGALAEALRDAQVRAALDAQLHDAGQIELVGEYEQEPEHRSYVIHADRLHDTDLGNRAGGPIEIVQRERGADVRRFQADAAQLLGSAGAPESASFDLVMVNYTVQDLQRGGTPNRRGKLTIPTLKLVGHEEDDISSLSSADLIRRAEATHGGPERLGLKTRKLQNEIQSLRREITSRLLNRYALSATAFLLLVLGAMLAMWLRGSLPLTTYSWAFMPSIVDLVLISAGEQMLRDGRLLGHITMWSGNVMLMAAIAWVYLRLAKH